MNRSPISGIGLALMAAALVGDQYPTYRHHCAASPTTKERTAKTEKKQQRKNQRNARKVNRHAK